MKIDHYQALKLWKKHYFLVLWKICLIRKTFFWHPKNRLKRKLLPVANSSFEMSTLLKQSDGLCVKHKRPFRTLLLAHHCFSHFCSLFHFYLVTIYYVQATIHTLSKHHCLMSFWFFVVAILLVSLHKFSRYTSVFLDSAVPLVSFDIAIFLLSSFTIVVIRSINFDIATFLLVGFDKLGSKEHCTFDPAQTDKQTDLIFFVWPSLQSREQTY